MIYLICLCVAGFVLALDLISKTVAVSQEFNVVIIPELLKFKLTYNKGASFSFLADKSWAIYMFIAVTVIVCLSILGFFAYTILKKKKPSFAYAINRNKLLLLLNALPKGVQCFAIKKILK